MERRFMPWVLLYHLIIREHIYSSSLVLIPCVCVHPHTYADPGTQKPKKLNSSRKLLLSSNCSPVIHNPVSSLTKRPFAWFSLFFFFSFCLANSCSQCCILSDDEVLKVFFWNRWPGESRGMCQQQAGECAKSCSD